MNGPFFHPQGRQSGLSITTPRPLAPAQPAGCTVLFSPCFQPEVFSGPTFTGEKMSGGGRDQQWKMFPPYPCLQDDL